MGISSQELTETKFKLAASPRLCVTQYPEVVRSPGQSAVKCNQLSIADPKLADLMIFQLPLKRGITSLLSILVSCYSILTKPKLNLSDKKIPSNDFFTAFERGK